MDFNQLGRLRNEDGLIAALDGCGAALTARVIACPSFRSDKVLAAVLQPEALEIAVNGLYADDYLWKVKGVVPIVRCDLGLEDETDGVRLMRPNPGLGQLLGQLRGRNVLGVCMRSLILWPDYDGIRAACEQQLVLSRSILARDLIPFAGFEIDTGAREKTACEEVLSEVLTDELSKMGDNDCMVPILTLPERAGAYSGLEDMPCVARTAASPGGYQLDEAAARFRVNRGMTPCLSAGLLQGLDLGMSDVEFAVGLADSINMIYDAAGY